MTAPAIPDEHTVAEDIVVQPDRADAPVSVVTERFLRAIIASVPLENIEELHLFSPLRSGSSETGIAVVAAREALTEATPALELGLAEDATAPIPLPNANPARHTISTARYRLAIKGPDRGKWETDVVAEADAPLVTVEMVVRGVQRRAGEDSAITRFSAAQIAHALRIDVPVT